MPGKDAQVAAVTAELEDLIEQARANVAALLAILDPPGTDPGDQEEAVGAL